MATVAKRRFIRADGPDKVTGSGRYTADLTLTGMLHAKFKYAGVTHGRITRDQVWSGRRWSVTLLAEMAEAADATT